MNTEQYALLQAAYKLGEQVELLAATPESMKQKGKSALEELKDKYISEAARMGTYYKRAVEAYQMLYGAPDLIGTTITLQDAGKMAYNVDLIALLTTAPSKLPFAKKAKAEQYHRFCKATIMMRENYNCQVDEAEAYLTSWYGGDCSRAENTFELLAEKARTNAAKEPKEWVQYPLPAEQRCDSIYFGDIELPLETSHAEPMLQRANLLDNENGELWLRTPFAGSLEDTFALFTVFQGKKADAEQQQSTFLRSTVYQMIRASAPYGIQITYLDPTMGGASLQELNQKLSSVVDGNAFRLREEIYHNRYRLLQIGTTHDECITCLRTLEALTGEINRYRGGGTLRAYNKERLDSEGMPIDCAQGGAIPKQIVIYEGAHGELDDSSRNILSRLVKLGPSCGITVIVTACLSEGEQLDDQEQQLLNSGIEQITLEANEGSLVLNDCSQDGNISHLRFNFAPYLEEHCHEQFLDQVIASMHPELSGETRIEKLINLADGVGMSCGDLAIQVSVGVNDRGNLVDFRLGDADCAHGIMAGHAGCGKSSLLHTIIYGIALKYRPEDVEIWLSDYKAEGVEFMGYQDGHVPHIRYVGAGSSMEYSYAFLNRIEVEYRRRAQAFAESGATSLAEYRKMNGPDSMPRLIIIVDEFHVLSDHVKEDPSKKEQLTNLLKEMRAMGMAVLFSDQTCGVGLGGLSEPGKQQLTARLAMQTSIDEYNAVFGISNSRDILPTMNVREVLVQKISTRVDAMGKTENHVYYEHAKTIFTNIPIRQQISQMLLEKYPNRPKPIFVKDAERELPPANLYTAETVGQIYIGGKLDGSGPVHFSVRPTFTENVMILAPVDEIAGSLVRSVLEAAEADPSAEIYVMAYEYDSGYAFLHPYLQSQKRIHVCDDMSELCRNVCTLTDEMQKRRKLRNPSPIYIFWVGLSDIGMELGYQSTSRPQAAPIRTSKQTSCVQQDTDSILAQLNDFTAFYSGDMETELPVLEDMPDQEDELDYLYNACEDIQTLMQEGPRRNMYHIVCYPGYSAAKMVKKNGMAKPEDFKHKLAVDISNDDAGEFFGSTRVNKTINGQALSPEIGIYYDGKTDQKFMPYRYDWESDYEHGC